jgi:NAD(P)H-dependent FMN reductase
MKILVIIGSTRANRNGERVKTWLEQQLNNDETTSYEMVDLRDINLPFYDEVKSVAGLDYEEYSHPEAVAWGKRVESADGFIFATPEYNHGPPATLKNAIDYAWQGWNYKPMSIISYSTGQIAGARAAEQLRLMALGVKLLPLPAAVHIAHITDTINEDGTLNSNKPGQALNKLTEELSKIAAKLKET